MKLFTKRVKNNQYISKKWKALEQYNKKIQFKALNKLKAKLTFSLQMKSQFLRVVKTKDYSSPISSFRLGHNKSKATKCHLNTEMINFKLLRHIVIMIYTSPTSSREQKPTKFLSKLTQVLSLLDQSLRNGIIFLWKRTLCMFKVWTKITLKLLLILTCTSTKLHAHNCKNKIQKLT